MSFNKFEWLKALQSDAAITGTSAFLVGVAVCTTFTRADGTGWVFDLGDLPNVGGRPLTPNTIKSAIRLLVSRRYLNQTYRSQGGRGVRASASFDLIPARFNEQVSAETPPAETCGFQQNPHVSTAKPARLNDKTRTFQRTKNRLDQREIPPTGTSTGTSSGSARDEPPPRYCPKHPTGTSDSCIPCKHARQTHEEWMRARDELEQAERDARRQARENCGRCGGTGQIEIADDLVDWCPDCSAWKREAQR